MRRYEQVIDYRRGTFQIIDNLDRQRTIIGYRGLEKEVVEPSLLRPFSQDRLIESIVVSEKPLILSRTRDNCPPWEINPATAGVESWAGIPVKWAGRVRGLITLDHEQPGYYTDALFNLLLSVAGQAAFAIERAEAVQALLRRIEIVEEVAQVISSELDVENLMQMIVRQVADTLRCTHCTLFLAETFGGESWLAPKMTYGSRPEILNQRFKIGEGLAGWVYQTGESLVLPDVRHHPLFAKAQNKLDRPRSMLVAPIKVGDQTIGVISVDQEEFGWFSESDRRLLDALAQQIGTAIQRSAGLKLVHEVGNRIVGSQDVNTVLQEIITGACQLTNTTAGNIYLLDENAQAVIEEYHYPSEFRSPAPRLRVCENIPCFSNSEVETGV